jgi:hypothetical protein
VRELAVPDESGDGTENPLLSAEAAFRSEHLEWTAEYLPTVPEELKLHATCDRLWMKALEAHWRLAALSRRLEEHHRELGVGDAECPVCERARASGPLGPE